MWRRQLRGVRQLCYDDNDKMMFLSLTLWRLRNIWKPTSFNCLFLACRACDYVYIDYVKHSRNSSYHLLHPINCQSYITLQSTESKCLRQNFFKNPARNFAIAIPWVTNLCCSYLLCDWFQKLLWLVCVSRCYRIQHTHKHLQHKMSE